MARLLACLLFPRILDFWPVSYGKESSSSKEDPLAMLVLFRRDLRPPGPSPSFTPRMKEREKETRVTVFIFRGLSARREIKGACTECESVASSRSEESEREGERERPVCKVLGPGVAPPISPSPSARPRVTTLYL